MRGRFRANITAAIVICMAITNHMAGIDIDRLYRDYEPPLLAKEQMALDEAIRTVEVINDIQLEASLIRANNGPEGSPPSVCAVE